MDPSEACVDPVCVDRLVFLVFGCFLFSDCLHFWIVGFYVHWVWGGRPVQPEVSFQKGSLYAKADLDQVILDIGKVMLGSCRMQFQESRKLANQETATRSRTQ